MPIFKAAGLGSQNITMRIVRHESFNAFVIDGRNVFMNTGTLMQAKTPNEVIGVIAHETGHIAGGHMAALRSRIARDADQEPAAHDPGHRPDGRRRRCRAAISAREIGRRRRRHLPWAATTC